MASTLMFIDEPAVFEAGEAYELVFERRDTNGFIGFVSPMIQSLTATSGGLSVDDENRVYWNPSSTGSATISGMDGTVSSSTTVDVQHGRAIDVQFQITPSSPTAGEVVIELMAEDVKGNRWVVNGTISMTMGMRMPSQRRTLTLLQAAERQSWRFDGNWFDNTGAMFVSDVVFDIEPGRLAFITLEEEGAQVPADGELDLSPAFLMPTTTNSKPSTNCRLTGTTSLGNALPRPMGRNIWGPRITGQCRRCVCNGRLSSLKCACTPPYEEWSSR